MSESGFLVRCLMFAYDTLIMKEKC